MKTPSNQAPIQPDESSTNPSREDGPSHRDLAARITAVVNAWEHAGSPENCPAQLITLYVDDEIDMTRDEAIAALASKGDGFDSPNLGGCSVYYDGRVQWDTGHDVTWCSLGTLVDHAERGDNGAPSWFEQAWVIGPDREED
ncbi:hypothetical protein [Paucibacter soli]|uniref:hypothetical protein n=1 Tax=Paucibacter soli TaxID=3133433 RepID=UPI0030AF0DC5